MRYGSDIFLKVVVMVTDLQRSNYPEYRCLYLKIIQNVLSCTIPKIKYKKFHFSVEVYFELIMAINDGITHIHLIKVDPTPGFGCNLTPVTLVASVVCGNHSV